MKKIIILTVILSSISSLAFAKTQGNYVGIYALRNHANVKSYSSLSNDNTNGNDPYYDRNRKNIAFGAGIIYKYAFNFNNFFVAPGISYDYLDNNKKSYYGSGSSYFQQNVTLNSALSLRADLGYDVNDKLAFYVPVGVSQFNYQIKTVDRNSTNYLKSERTDNKNTAFIGVGFSYQPIKNWVVNLEYNKFQSVKLVSTTATISGGRIIAKTNLDMVKFGVAYHF